METQDASMKDFSSLTCQNPLATVTGCCTQLAGREGAYLSIPLLSLTTTTGDSVTVFFVHQSFFLRTQILRQVCSLCCWKEVMVLARGSSFASS